MPLSEETFGANCCQPRAHLRPHSERIIPSVTVDMSMTKEPNSTTSSHVTTILKLDGGLALNLMLIMVDLTKVPDYWVTMYTLIVLTIL